MQQRKNLVTRRVSFSIYSETHTAFAVYWIYTLKLAFQAIYQKVHEKCGVAVVEEGGGGS
ncbi:MAG: hypothetical protein ACI8ZB_001341 [Desulforhopalus sp.]|jgi:hypothetical protein